MRVLNNKKGYFYVKIIFSYYETFIGKTFCNRFPLVYVRTMVWTNKSESKLFRALTISKKFSLAKLIKIKWNFQHPTAPRRASGQEQKIPKLRLKSKLLCERVHQQQNHGHHGMQVSILLMCISPFED